MAWGPNARMAYRARKMATRAYMRAHCAQHGGTGAGKMFGESPRVQPSAPRPSYAPPPVAPAYRPTRVVFREDVYRAQMAVQVAGLLLIGSLVLLWALGCIMPRETADRFLWFSVGALTLEGIVVAGFWSGYRRAAEGLAEHEEREAERQRQLAERERPEVEARVARLQAEAEARRAREEAEAAARRGAEERERQRTDAERIERERRQCDKARASAVLAAFRAETLRPIETPIVLLGSERCFHVTPAEFHAGTFGVPDVPGRPDASPRFVAAGTLIVTTHRLVFRERTGKEYSVPLAQILALGAWGTDGLTIQVDRDRCYYIFRLAMPAEVAAFLLCMFYVRRVRPTVGPALGDMVGAVG